MLIVNPNGSVQTLSSFREEIEDNLKKIKPLEDYLNFRSSNGIFRI